MAKTSAMSRSERSCSSVRMVVVEVILVSGGGEQERERAEVDCDIDPRLILR